MGQSNDSKIKRPLFRPSTGHPSPIRVERVNLDDPTQPRAGQPVRMDQIPTAMVNALPPAWTKEIGVEHTGVRETVEEWERHWERETRRYRSWERE